MRIKPKTAIGIILAWRLCIQPAPIPQDEWIFENSEESDRETEEILKEFRSQKPDLNFLSPEQLQNFPDLKRDEVSKIIENRSRSPFTDWEDLESRTGFDIELVRSMRDCFSIHPAEKKPSDLNIQVRERALYKFPEAAGYRTGAYPGSAVKMLHRIQILYRDRIEAGVLIEKDPGEPDWTDHLTGYSALHCFRDHARLVAGHFSIQTGFGLVLGGPYGTGKSAAPLAVISRNDTWTHGHLYADENRYMTGTAMECRWRGIQGLLFFSNTAKDARTDSLISSFPSSGLHRTDGEREARKTIRERMSGGRISVSLPLGTVGCTAWRNHYSLPVAAPDPVRQKYGFQGSGNQVTGLDWKLNFRMISWGGEWARSPEGDAWIAFIALKCRGLEWILSFRNFSRSFQNPYASGFGFGDPNNERGWYAGGQIRPAKGLTVCFYMDLYRSLWRTYRIPVPPVSSDLWIQTDQRFSGLFTLSCQFRQRTGCSAAEGRTLYGISQEVVRHHSHRQFAVLWTCTPGTHWILRTRLKQVLLNDHKLYNEIIVPRRHEQGFLLGQDMRYKSRSIFFWTIQAVVFDTDSYDSRIYIYEQDLPGIMSNTALYGKGLMWNLVSGINLQKRLQFTLKLGITVKDRVPYMGTGYDLISGDTVKDLGVQIDIDL